MLEDALQPQRLYWLVHAEIPSATPSDLEMIMGHLRAMLSENKAQIATYQREVMQVYAAIWLRHNAKVSEAGPCISRYVPRGIEETGLSSPDLEGEALRLLCSELVYAPKPRYDAVRLLMYSFIDAAYVAMPKSDARVEPFGTATRDALHRILQRYAPECTFKTRGDFNVHTELLVNKLPSWISSAMVHNEMPYPLMVKVYPDNVNKVVRPLLDRAITDSLDMAELDAQVFKASDFITMMSLIIEILASRDVHLLVNGCVVRGRARTWPLPYLWRGRSGVLHHGVRHNGTLHAFSDTVSATDTCLRWLQMCHIEGVEACKNMSDLLFDAGNVAERNPLKKFLF